MLTYDMRIFVYSFYLMTYAHSYRMKLIIIKPLNIKSITISVISENLSPIYCWFCRNPLLNTRNFTKNAWLITYFATQQFLSFKRLIFTSILLFNKLKIAQIVLVNQLIQRLNLVSIYGYNTATASLS